MSPDSVSTDCILITVMLPAATLIMLYRAGGEKKKRNYKRDSELFSMMMWHLKTKRNNKVATMAERWEFGVGVSYGSASITKLNNTCMVTVDYLGSKTGKEKKKELVRRQSTAMTKTHEEEYHRKISAVKTNLYITVHHHQ